MNRLSLLLPYVCCHHLICKVSSAYRQITPGPQVSAPKSPLKMRKLLKEYSRAYPLKPLHNHTHVNVWSVRDQNVNVVAGNISRQNRYLAFHSYLPYKVAHTYRHLPSKHLLAVLRDPDQVNLKIVLRVRAQLIPFHATTLHDPILRLQGEGVRPSPMGTLMDN